MVQDRSRGGPHFDCRDPGVFLQVEGNDEVAIDVAATRWHFEARRHLHNQVGFPELPALDELWQWRQLLLRSLWHPPLDPARHRLHLRVGQPQAVAEGTEALDRMPRRHEPVLDDLLDRLASLLHVGVAQQRERRHFPRPVALGTAGEHDRRHVLGEGGDLVRLLRQRHEGQQQKCEVHGLPHCAGTPAIGTKKSSSPCPCRLSDPGRPEADRCAQRRQSPDLGGQDLTSATLPAGNRAPGSGPSGVSCLDRQ